MQSVPIVEVVRLDGVRGAAVEKLGATLRRQQIRVAIDLGHLDGELSGCGCGGTADIEVQ